jgi:hypothetical protein
MIWALLGLVVVVVGVFSLSVILALQSVSETLSNALRTLERVHTNDGKRIDTILDRFMAMDFQMFKNYQLAEEAEEGGQEIFEEEPTVRLEVPGITREYGEADLVVAAAEREILREDFPEESEVPQ